jgi:dihydroorotate dehydrogenase (fumarate)
MVDLSTSYLGLKLATPLVVSASPLSQELDTIRRLEEAGASAIVLYSLFEEQLRQESLELDQRLTAGTESFAESLSYFPQPREFHLGPEGYLKHIRKAKETVGVPIIASLNGTSAGGWIEYAKQIQQAGADALECNIYWIPADPDKTSAEIEQRYLDILKAVKSAVTIPVAVKLGPHFTNFSNFARRLDEGGADALVLFNRFYQPDVDLEHLEIRPSVLLSTEQELRLPLTWIGILYGRVRAQLAATSGVHQAEDALKLLLVGATVTMLCSALFRNGLLHLGRVERGIRAWMEEHEYESVTQMRGSMSQKNVAHPGEYERAQYMRAIKGYQHVVLDSDSAWRILTGD